MQALREKILAHHIEDPEHKRFNGHMLYSLYDDGEISLSKAGDLWGQRSLHVIHYGFPTILELNLPCKMKQYTYAIIENDTVVRQLRSEIESLMQSNTGIKET